MRPLAFRYLAVIAGAWLVGGFLLAFFDRALWDRLWVLTFGIWALYVVLGAGIWLAVLWRTRRASRRSSEVGLALAMPLGALVLWLALPHITRAGDQFLFTQRFATLHARYEALVAEVRRTGAPSPQTWTTRGGIQFQVDSGPPVRVAFLQPGGILDNWEGVVYDPTGRVTTATGWRAGVPGNYSAAPDVVGLFGGALVRCEPIEGAYYRCWFT